MTFRDLDDFLVVRPIELPIRGKTYQFPGTITARAGLLLQRITAAVGGEASEAQAVLDGAEASLREEILGDTEAQMVEDGLTAAHVNHVLQTLMVWHMAGPEAAEAAWEQMAADPQEPNRAERRAATAKKSNRSPASPAGSTSRRKPPAARRGEPSSSTGS